MYNNENSLYVNIKPSPVLVWPNRPNFHQNQAGSNNDNIQRTHFQCLNAMLSFTFVRYIYLKLTCPERMF